MNNNDNHGKQNHIYDKQTRTWFEVTPEQFEEYDRWRTRIRKREQYHGRCMCPAANGGCAMACARTASIADQIRVLMRSVVHVSRLSLFSTFLVQNERR